MDPLEAVEYARILLKVPNKFESVKNLAERDQAAAKKLSSISSIGSSEEFAIAGKLAGATFSTEFVNTVGTMIQSSLPDLSAVAAALTKAQTVQNEKSMKPQIETSNFQNSTETNMAKIAALLEGLAVMLNSSMEKKTTLSFNPTFEASVNMDGEKVAKIVTKHQQEYQIQSNT